MIRRLSRVRSAIVTLTEWGDECCTGDADEMTVVPLEAWQEPDSSHRG
nr:hypothetical protein [Kibdelosporangium sp. MJ126-NF4]CTQ88619.1 hypothetical protein [Kibdelosporangium sp. MJ126-NF4]